MNAFCNIWSSIFMSNEIYTGIKISVFCRFHKNVYEKAIYKGKTVHLAS